MGRGRIPRRKLLLALVDGVVLAALVIGAVVFRFVYAMGWERGLDYARGYVAANAHALSLAWVATLVMLYLCGLYELNRMNNPLWVVGTTVLAVALSMLLIAGIFYATFFSRLGPGILLGRGVLGLYSVTTFVTIVLLRLMYVTASERGLLARRALVIGSGREAALALALVRARPHSGLRVYGLIGLGEEPVGSFLEGFPVLGRVESLDDFVRLYDIETLLMAVPREREGALLCQLRPFRYRGVELVDFVSLHEELGSMIPIDHIDEEWLLRASLNNSRLHIRKLKGIMDLLIAVVGMTLFLPFGLIVAGLIKLDSRGPVFYCQRRLGRERKEFSLVKFRTMREGAEDETGPTWASEDDPRITRVGRLLRKYRIDEVPQLYNVLRGEMSLVGPRPERPVFVDRLRAEIPFYEERLMVRPGITGWAQVMYPYADDVEGAVRKLQYDIFYIKHMSFWLDVLILLRTIRIVLLGRERAARSGAAAAAAAAVAADGGIAHGRGAR